MEQNKTARETGLYDPDVFRLLAEHELSRAQRYPTPLTLLYISLYLNEANPENAKNVKQLFAGILNSSLRLSDIPSQYGDDFVVLLPSTDEAGGVAASKRLISRLKGTRNFADGNLFKFYIHIGITTHPGGKKKSLDQILNEAQIASQKAKRIGSQALAVYSG